MSAPAPSPLRSPFESLPRNVAASSILPYAASSDWLSLRAACRGCYEIVHGAAAAAGGDGGGDDGNGSPWRLALIRDYGFARTDAGDVLRRCVRCPADPQQSDAFLSTGDIFVAPNLFVSWKHWRKIDLRLHHRSPRGSHIPPSERVVGPYFLRACSLWRKIERWCLDEARSGTLGRDILSSLSPGRGVDPNSRGGVPNAKTSAIKAVYAFYAGQRDPMTAAPAAHPHRFNPFTGLFGGVQAYNFISSTRWMEPAVEDEGDQRFVIVAQSDEKVIVMELETGRMYFIASGTRGRGRTLLAAPGAQVGVNDGDSVLRWFEEHADRLHRDHYSVGNIVPHLQGGESLLSLLRYPTRADAVGCSRAVTRGVEVLASAVFVPEMAMFVYSIRVRLLALGDGEGYVDPGQRGFDTCQLLGRHWRITKSIPGLDPSVDEVRGEGVIGLYPLLHEGGYVNYEGGADAQYQAERGAGHFSYQSCTQADAPGFMEGHLEFRPGSMAEPCGESFDVQVAPFPLEFARFLY